MFLDLYNSRLFTNVNNQDEFVIDKKMKRRQESRCEYIYED